MIGLDRKERNNQLDRMWLETVFKWFHVSCNLSWMLMPCYCYWPLLFQLLCLVGEAFEEHGDIVCGAVVNIRPKGDKLAVWTEDANNMEANMKVGYVWP
jgi:hypothetical protein